MNGGAIAIYQYDAFGRRVRKILDTLTTIKTYDYDDKGQFIELRTSGTAPDTLTFVYDEEVSMTDDNGVSHNTFQFQRDGSGMITGLIGPGGNIVERVSYDLCKLPTIRKNPMFYGISSSGIYRTNASGSMFGYAFPSTRTVNFGGSSHTVSFYGTVDRLWNTNFWTGFSLTEANNGLLYGYILISSHNPASREALFSFDPYNDSLTILYVFPPLDSVNLQGVWQYPIQASNG